MNRGQIILTLTLSLLTASVAWAQGDDKQQPTPAPAFGQDNPAPTVSENPPISAIDQPGLEPHAAPESFLLPGLHFSESADTNVGNQLGGSTFSTVTRGLGSLTLQKLWKNYDLAMDYVGGAAYYNQSGIGLEQLQQFDMDNRINWKRGQLAIRDSFSYLPEGTFGFSAYGGEGAYNSGLGSLGAGLLGSAAFAGQASAFNGGSTVSLGQVPRLTNLGLVDVVENLTPKSAVTVAAGYALVHFYGDIESPAGSEENISFIGSREFTAQAAYDRVLNAKDQVALSYGYQAFDFSTVNTSFHASVIQIMYGHRVSGRMDFTIGAGPQFTHLDADDSVCIIPVPLNDCTADGCLLRCLSGESQSHRPRRPGVVALPVPANHGLRQLPAFQYGWFGSVRGLGKQHRTARCPKAVEPGLGPVCRRRLFPERPPAACRIGHQWEHRNVRVRWSRGPPSVRAQPARFRELSVQQYEFRCDVSGAGHRTAVQQYFSAASGFDWSGLDSAADPA